MSKRSGSAAAKNATGALPPDLAKHVGSDAFKALNPGQRDGILRLYESGYFSAEEVAAELKSLKDGTFKCKYLGSVPVAAAKLTPAMWEMFGKQVIGTAYAKLKKQKIKPIDAVLSCTGSGLRVVEDSPEANLIEDESLAQLEFAGIDSGDKKRFGYLTHYSRLGLIFCHLFSGKSKNDVIVQSINTLLATRPKPPPVTEADKHEKTTGATLGIFEVNYLGQVPLNHLRLSLAITGSEELQMRKQLSESVTYALGKLQLGSGQADADIENKIAAVLVVSSEGIRAIELSSRDMLSSVWIEHIQYTTEIIGRKSKLFALIARERSDIRSCFIYSCPMNEAAQICDKLNEAKALFREDLTSRAGNPFMAATKITEAVTGPLAACQVARRDLTAQVAIGAGQFGEVYLATEKCGVEPSVVLKRRAVKMLRGGAATDDKAQFLLEGEMNYRMRHENIVAVTGACFSARPWLVILELCSYGDLQGVLKTCGEKKFTLRYSEQLSWSIQLAKALGYIADQGFVHMDVAARNVMVDEGHRIKLGDFGLAHAYDEGKPFWVMRKAMQLSIRWLCYEIMGPPPKCASEKSDVWSFGVTLWEMFSYCKRRPFHRYKLQEVQSVVRAGGRLSQPKDCPVEMYQLMNWCWQKSAKKRPNFSQLVTELTKFATADGIEPIRDVGLEINMLLETEKMAPESPDNRLSLHSVGWDGTFLDQFDN